MQMLSGPANGRAIAERIIEPEGREHGHSVHCVQRHEAELPGLIWKNLLEAKGTGVLILLGQRLVLTAWLVRE